MKHLPIAILALLIIPGCITTDTKQTNHTDKVTGLSFEHPNSFVMGKFKPVEIPEQMKGIMEAPFKNAIVLIEESELGEIERDDIPVGEAAVIWLEVQSGDDSTFYKTELMKEEYRTKIAGTEVYELPGYPGPFGSNAYYYLLPIGDSVVEIGAHKSFINSQPKSLTNYNTVILEMIPTIKLGVPAL